VRGGWDRAPNVLRPWNRLKEFAWSPYRLTKLAFHSWDGGKPDEAVGVNADGTHQVNLGLAPRSRRWQRAGGKAAGSFLWHPLGGKLIYEQVGPAGRIQPQTYQGLWEVNSFTGKKLGNQRSIQDFRKINQGGLAGWMAGGKLLLVWRKLRGFRLHDRRKVGPALAVAHTPGSGRLSRSSICSPIRINFSADPTNTGRLAVISGMGGENLGGTRDYTCMITTASHRFAS